MTAPLPAPSPAVSTALPPAFPAAPPAPLSPATPVTQRGWRQRLLGRSQEAGPRMAVGLEQVSKRFGEVVALENVSLQVSEGAIVGFIGPSGAGKTTAIRLMTGALAPDAGLVRVLGEDPRRFHRRTRERIGYMPQLFVLYPDLTARENIDFMAALFGIPPWQRGRLIRDVLELVDLTEAKDRRASALSGGMQRRLELACALVHQPSLLILDEPTAGIDPLLRTRIWQELDRRRKSGATVIVTTQYVTEAEYCDAVALISEGNLVAFATPHELRRRTLGGEVIEVVTAAPLEASMLPPLEGVIEVRQQGPRQLLFVVENAGTATPLVNDAIESAGGTVESSREHHPTFDEVFAALVTGHAERDKTGGGQSGAGAIPQSMVGQR